jgi:hypothetical protein
LREPDSKVAENQGSERIRLPRRRRLHAEDCVHASKIFAWGLRGVDGERSHPRVVTNIDLPKACMPRQKQQGIEPEGTCFVTYFAQA